MKTAYITGSTETSWRDEAIRQLVGMGWDYRDPLRGLQESVKQSYIYRRNRRDIEQSDVVIVNGVDVGKQGQAIGTSIEIGIALALNKPVVIFGLDPVQSHNPFLLQCTQVKSLHAALSEVL